MKVDNIKTLLNKIKAALGTKQTDNSSPDFHFIKQFVLAFKEDLYVLGNNDFADELNNHSVNGKDLLKVLDLIKDDVEITVDEDNMHIRAKGTKAVLPLVTTETAELIFDSLSFSWKNVKQDFCDGLHLAAFSASTENFDGELGCVFLTENRIEATDGQRVVCVETTVHVKKDILLSAKTVKRLPKTFTKISVTDNFFSVFEEVTGCIYCLPIVEAEFFTLQSTIEAWKSEKGKKLQVEIPTELVKIAKELSAFVPNSATTDEQEKTMTIIYKEKFIQCTVESGSAKVVKKIKNTTKTQEFGFEINAFVLSKLPEISSGAYILNNKLFFSSENITYVVGL